MRTKLAGILSLIFISFATASYAQQAAQCTDSDHSQVVNGVLRLGADRLVRGTVRGRSRVTGRQDVAGDRCMPNGTLLEYFCANATDIGGSTVRCQQGEVCNDGACMRPIVLNQCGAPQGGWQSGKTYVLENDIVLTHGDVDFCFVVDAGGREEFHDIVIDCQGHSIVREGVDEWGDWGGGVFVLRHVGRKMEIKNCTIAAGFAVGIGIVGPGGDLELSNVDIHGASNAIEVTGARSFIANNVRSCHNSTDLSCQFFDRNVSNVSGGRNHFGIVSGCQRANFPDNFYSGCE